MRMGIRPIVLLAGAAAACSSVSSVVDGSRDAPAHDGSGVLLDADDARAEASALEVATVFDAPASASDVITLADVNAREGGPCRPTPEAPGDYVRRITFDGRTREFRVHVPPSYDGTEPAMVVLNFHGYMSDEVQQNILSHMNRSADERGFIAVHPRGEWNSWNAGLCCGYGRDANVDDVGFVRAMLDTLEREYCVDRRRIFATGMSNGGFLSHRLACELSDRIAAIAPVAGVIGVDPCVPMRAVPVLHFHGTADALVPYNGGWVPPFPSVSSTIAGWASRDGCTDAPREVYRRGDSHCETRTRCTDGAEVQLCTVEGGGHTWPGGFPVPTLGHTTYDLDATSYMLDFFERHPMP